MLEHIITKLNEHIDLSSRCIEPLVTPISDAVMQMCQSLLSQNNILCASSTQSRYIAQRFAHYMQHQFKYERPALPCISLCDIEPASLEKNLSSIGKADDTLLFFQHPDCNLKLSQLNETCAALNIKLIIIGGIACSQNYFKNHPICISIPSEDNIAVLEIQHLIMHNLCELIDLQLFDNKG